MTSPSGWGRIETDTIERVTRIKPTATRTKRWHHAKDSRSTSVDVAGGDSFRQFRCQLETGTENRVSGAGERQEEWTLILVTSYPRIADLQAVIAADYKDLVEALNPTSTYVKVASVVNLCSRNVKSYEGPLDAGEGVEVRYMVRCVFRFPVTMI